VKDLILLGSTGSMGESALDVARFMAADFRIAALSCNTGTRRLEAQIAEFTPKAVAVSDPAAAGALRAPSGVRVYSGAEGMMRMIEETPADIALNGISGAAGLLPSFACLRSVKTLALANKESLVMAGPLLLDEACRHGASIIPVDSEHAAIFSLFRTVSASDVEELIITASGGAFRSLPLERLGEVTLEDALRHPTWKMGPKITVDSATMANKGLEVIEAHRLFGAELRKIRVLIHPQSYVHAMVRTRDGTLHAEIYTTDMRIPIQNALTYPDMLRGRVEWLDLAGKTLDFGRADPARYPMLALAYRAAEGSPAHPIVYNAANEEAVSAFMAARLSFTGIPDVVERALSRSWTGSVSDVAEILEIDAASRMAARELIR
jgi:1-deoxy-D-xylulose-5-phosphate reductoisomerase